MGKVYNATHQRDDDPHDWIAAGFGPAIPVWYVNASDIADEFIGFMDGILLAGEQQGIDFAELLGMGTNQINTKRQFRYEPYYNELAQQVFGTPGMHKQERGPRGNRKPDATAPPGVMIGGNPLPYGATRR